MSLSTEANGSTYYSYLLRMWQVHTSDNHTWRIQLENVRSGEKRGFTSLEELLAYLQRVTIQEGQSTGEGS